MNMKRLMILAAMMAAVACGDDSGSDTPDDTTTKSDAGKSSAKDASKDTGSSDEGEDAGDEPVEEEDASTDEADAGKTDASAKDAGSSSGDACADLTYEAFGKDFMDTYCASCHAASVKNTARMGAPADDVYDTLAQIKAAKAKLMKEVVTEKSMPFVTSKTQPTDDERTQFGAWLDCGPN